MGLNIKNPGTEASIRKLAARTGESLTEAVANAVRERLARLEKEAENDAPARTAEEFLERIRPFQEEAAAFRRQHGDARSFASFMKDVDDESYDESGLPR